MTSSSTNFLLALLPAAALAVASWHLTMRSVPSLLTIAGGLFCQIILSLYPVLLFNKSYGGRDSKKDYSLVRNFNWIAFGLSIAVGAGGTYSGMSRLIYG